MLAEIGFIGMVLGFGAAAYAAFAAAVGARTKSGRWVQSAWNAAILTLPLLSLACGALLAAIFVGDYTIDYVYRVTNNASDWTLKIAGLWSAQKGSLLFWSWLMSAFAVITLWANRRRMRDALPYVIAVTMVTLAFFLALNVFLENPFDRIWLIRGDDPRAVAQFFPPPGDAALFRVPDGQGLRPLLQHPGMLYHPPTLYLGFVGLTIPFAFAVAALFGGEVGNDWARQSRIQTLVAWLFLSFGLLLGGRWAYDVLGWGGYWAWDPVENAALLPWLTGTAFLHGVVIQERRGMLKTWNMLLILHTFILVIFGTFATRSGVVSSVHAFAESDIGAPMFAFLAVTWLGSLLLVVYRWWRGDLRSDNALDGLLSREVAFMVNNFLFTVIAAAVFLGSYLLPIATELFLNEKITVGPEYFNTVTGPLFGAVLLLMGIAPVMKWRHMEGRELFDRLAVAIGGGLAVAAVCVVTGMQNAFAIIGFGIAAFSGLVHVQEISLDWRSRMRRLAENPLVAFGRMMARNRRRYGGYVIHLGIVLIGLGVIGSMMFQQETQRRLEPGESLSIGGYRLVYDEPALDVVAEGRRGISASLRLFRGDTLITYLRPRRDLFFDTFERCKVIDVMTVPAQHPTLERDFYVILADTPDVLTSESLEECVFVPENIAAAFRVYINPLVNLLWWGGGVLTLGTVIAMWPQRKGGKKA